jgi:hypothetical protein
MFRVRLQSDKEEEQRLADRRKALRKQSISSVKEYCKIKWK